MLGNTSRGAFTTVAIALVALLAPAMASADETFVVDTLADGVDDNPGDRICRTAPGGPCTLRAAVMEGNAPTYSATETLTIELGPGEHLLTRPLDVGSPQSHGALIFVNNAPVVIEGAGADRTTIRQTQPTRVISQSAANTLTLRTLTITGGNVDGDDDAAGGNGGGIRAIADLHLEGVLVIGNRAGPETGNELLTGIGGGVFATGPVTMERSSIIDNDAERAGGLSLSGGAPSPATIENALIADNRAVGTGGAEIAPETLIEDLAVRGNTSTGGTGDPVSGMGGIYFLGSQTQTLRGVEVSGNTGYYGGLGTGGATRIWNATISGNHATGGGIWDGSGIELNSSSDFTDVEIYNVTVTGNTGSGPSAISSGDPGSAAGAPPDVRLSVLDGDCNFVVDGGAHNFESGSSCLPAPTTNGDTQNADLQLGPLADNGGATLTHLPAATSPVLDVATRRFGEDQRDAPRPPAGSDAGAVERNATPPPAPPAPPLPDTTPPDTVIDSGPSGTISTASASFSFHGAPAADTAKLQCRLDGAAYADCTSPLALTGLADGVHVFRVRAEDAAGNRDGTPAVRGFVVDTTPGEPTGPGADETAPALRIKGRQLKLSRRRKARALVVCPADEASSPCSGKLKLKTRHKLNFGGKRHTVKLAAKRYEIPAGASERVALRLTKRKSLLVRHKRRARRVLAKTRVSDAAGNHRRIQKRMRLKPKRR